MSIEKLHLKIWEQSLFEGVTSKIIIREGTIIRMSEVSSFSSMVQHCQEVDLPGSAEHVSRLAPPKNPRPPPPPPTLKKF